MAYLARVTYTGNGSTTGYALPFTYIATSHIYAYLDGVNTTAFTVSGATLTFTSAPANAVVITIKRITPTDARLVDFTDGSVLTETDLDQSADQNFYIAQEVSDTAQTHMGLTDADVWDATNKKIINLANPTSNQDTVTKYYLENTWLSAQNKADLTALVAITGLSALAANEANINKVANIDSDVTTVAGKETEIGLLGTSDAVSDMNTLAVSGVITNLNTVAGQVTPTNNIATLAGISSDITAVANISSDIQDVQDKLAEIETAADDLNEATSEIDTVANAITNVDLVGNAIGNVNLVGGSIANVNTVGTNIAGVNSFADRYRVGSTNPSSSLDEGDLFYNSSDNALKYYNGTSWASITAGIGSLADDTTPELGGDLSLNGNSIDFPTTPNISDVLDEDTMSSDSATKLATQQSIKAYVDSSTGTSASAGFAIAMAVAL